MGYLLAAFNSEIFFLLGDMGEDHPQPMGEISNL
jgi:hypothetical protein